MRVPFGVFGAIWTVPLGLLKNMLDLLLELMC